MTENGDSANGLEICSGNSESTDNYYSCSRYRKAEREIKHATQRCCSRSRGKNRSRFCGKALVCLGRLLLQTLRCFRKLYRRRSRRLGALHGPCSRLAATRVRRCGVWQHQAGQFSISGGAQWEPHDMELTRQERHAVCKIEVVEPTANLTDKNMELRVLGFL